MSSYRSTTTMIDAHVVGAYDLLEGQCDALLAGMCSADVAELAVDLARLPEPAGSPAWARLDETMPGWERHLAAASLRVMDGAREGRMPLPAALREVAVDLAALERRAVTLASEDALSDLGYQVHSVEGAHTSAVEARRGHEVFLVVVRDQGRIETDHVGLADDSCTDRQADFVDAMASRGVVFDEGVTIQHHDPRGGSAVSVAAAAGGATLAEGAVLAGDALPSFTTTLFAPHAAATAALSEGGQR